MHPHSRACTHAHARAHTHTHAHMHTRTHTHTHTQVVEGVFAKMDTLVLERIAKIMSYIKTTAGACVQASKSTQLRAVQAK